MSFAFLWPALFSENPVSLFLVHNVKLWTTLSLKSINISISAGFVKYLIVLPMVKTEEIKYKLCQKMMK